MIRTSPIVQWAARPMVPFIQLYALYVLGHGEDGPGGGFQGGVIFAASFILLGLTQGWGHGRSVARESVVDVLAPTGCLIYGGIGLACLLAGGAFLEYEALAPAGDPILRNRMHQYGLMGIEFGICVTVAAAMATLYFEMSRPDEEILEGEDDGAEAPGR